tara:strand:+ start:431 stop:784 length:354 start_codon:yes stop_codon:yes gene_type:complete
MERDVAKPEWGIKRFCPSCGAAFYDLNNVPITCPKCESSFEPEQLTRLKRSKSAPTDSSSNLDGKEKDTDDAELEDSELEDDDTNDDSVLEDASDLGGGDELAGVVDAPADDKKDDA